jgi:hypothetical protein
MSHPIPFAALDDRLGFVGTAGSGKTYNASACVERLLDAGARVVVVDPLDVWWGLRLNAEGAAPSQYSMPIFGGAHADLPITERAGALIGETVASMAESCIVSLGSFGTKAAERRFMLAFLDAIYRKANGEPVHLIFDEADLWAPQKTSEPMLQARMEEICRRGRIKGLIPWLISQRPAVISKDVLSQVDGLIAFKLTSSQDRDALEGWIEGQADRQQWKDIRATLPTLQQGRGVVWLPGRGVLTTESFPSKRTFDSSRTPKRGEKKRTAALKPINLGVLKERLAGIEAEAKANDPKELKAEIAKLKSELAKAARDVQVVDPAALEKAEERGFDRAKKQLTAAAERQIHEVHLNILQVMRERIAPLDALLDDEIKRAKAAKIELAKAVQFAPAPPLPAPRPVASRPTPQRTQYARDDADRPLGAERRPLSVLASVYPAGMTEAQWAVAAGLKRSGGTWAAYVSRLRTAGRIEQRDGLFFATDIGIADLGGQIPTMPAPGPELVEYWASRISGVGPMLRFLAANYPHWVSREELAEELNLAAGGGTFSAYLSRLRSPGLIEEGRDKNVRAAATLMEAAA